MLRLNSNGFSFFPTRIAQGVHITKEVKLDGYVNSNGMLINAFLVLSQGLWLCIIDNRLAPQTINNYLSSLLSNWETKLQISLSF